MNDQSLLLHLVKNRVPQSKDIGTSSSFSNTIHVSICLILKSWLFLTYDATVFALKCGAGASDGPTGAGAAEGGAAGRAVERGTWAVSAGRRRAAG